VQRDVIGVINNIGMANLRNRQ